MNVVMIGAGYVGLVSGACFAEFGANVTCVDVDASKIKALQAANIPIYEPGLDDLVSRNVKGGRLKFSDQLKDWIADADLVFLNAALEVGKTMVLGRIVYHAGMAY